MTTRTDYRDAIGWLYAHHRGDWEARNQLAQMTSAPGLVDALTHLLLGLARLSTNDNIPSYLDHIRDNLDSLLDEAGIEADE